MAVIERQVLTDLSRKITMDGMIGISPTPAFATMKIGDGGFDSNGDIIEPNSTMTQIRGAYKTKQIKTKKLDDFTCVFYITINTDTEDSDMIGRNLNEIGLYDSDGNLIAIRTFNGYGVIPAGFIQDLKLKWSV